MNATYINMLLALAVIVVPIGFAGLLLELKERQERKPQCRHCSDEGTPECGIINPDHSADGT